MAVGALIGADQEDELGGLGALLPLARRALIEYQGGGAAGGEAAPLVVIVERGPQALQDALGRLRRGGVGMFAVSDVQEVVSGFEAGSMIVLMGRGSRRPPIWLRRSPKSPNR